MARIFLSHSTVDKPIVRRIAEALRSGGHDPWLDENEILVGDSIPAAVERGLESTDYVIVCISAAALSSGWVQNELHGSVMKQFSSRMARVLPVRLEPVTPPSIIGHILYVDLFPDDEAFRRGIDRLLRSISGHAARAKFPP